MWYVLLCDPDGNVWLRLEGLSPKWATTVCEWWPFRSWKGLL